MDTVKIEQMLFGYENGHKLLASSLDYKLIQQKDLEILSDASGSGKFKDYISCFPLILDGYYVFSKTWYADEMQRPGCVWTHALLVRFEDLILLQDNINWNSLFIRPEKNTISLKDYNSTLSVKYLDEKSNIQMTHLYYVIYTLFYTNKISIIEDSEHELYDAVLLELLPRLPVELLSRLSVCSYSMKNRYIKNEVFSYQITGVGNSKKLAWDIKDSIIYRSKETIEEYPLWVKYLSNKFLNNEQKQIYTYCEKFQCFDREFIKDFSKLLYATNEFKSKYSLDSFLKLTEKLEEGKLIHDKVLELLFIEDDEIIKRCFDENSIVDQLILEMQNLEGILLKEKKSALKNAKKIYLSGDKDKIKTVFSKYLHNELNDYGKLIVNELIKLIQPHELDIYFDMDINICSVLVASDLRFLLCKDIWKQNRNYQFEMLLYARNRNVPRARDIVACIMDNTIEDISNEVYEIFPNDYLNVLYQYFQNEDFINSNRAILWGHHLAINSEKCADIILNIHNGAIIIDIMKNTDSYKMDNVKEIEAWIRVVHNNMEYILNNYKYETALFMLPMVLRYKEISTTISDFVYDEINNKLKDSVMDYYDWKKIEYLLPTVDLQQSWDKCLRLRLAFGK